ncbi:hypothetical protein A8C56_01430 [Niabella ginsenosidivorans]|uniref:Thioredoxin-like fold domain-containing protein n=2 Tax=Niabella ginsenosidivorans TaxID=1176587 RepID=A0A1A9HZB5_9BACT|nr:hypothetical protein A8C56_01430 [Niabella ginsenosidivorans]
MSFAELDWQMTKEKKYVVVYIRSKHCTYCLMQEAQLRKNSHLKLRLERDFYFVEGKAEEDSVIVFDHTAYGNPDPQNPRQVNDFVTVYGKDKEGMVGYPLWLYFDKNYRLLLRFYGLMPPENILKILDRISAVSGEQ